MGDTTTLQDGDDQSRADRDPELILDPKAMDADAAAAPVDEAASDGEIVQPAPPRRSRIARLRMWLADQILDEYELDGVPALAVPGAEPPSRWRLGVIAVRRLLAKWLLGKKHSLDRTDRVWFTTQRMWFAEVFLRKLVGHVQGIAFQIRPPDDLSDTHKVALFASVSDFPPGWGALLINDNHHLIEPNAHPYSQMHSASLPMGDHPGGIDIDGNVMAIPFEHRDRDAWFGLWDIREHLNPTPFAYHPFAQPTGPVDPGFDLGKASASGVVDTGAGYVVATLSQNRWLRLSRGGFDDSSGTVLFDTTDPINLEEAAAAEQIRWPRMVDGCALVCPKPRSAFEPTPIPDTKADGPPPGTLPTEEYLARLEAATQNVHGCFQLVLFGTQKGPILPWGTDSYLIVDLHIGKDPRIPPIFTNWRRRELPWFVGREGQVRQTILDFFRPSTRWGSTAFWTPGERCTTCPDSVPTASCEHRTTKAHLHIAVAEHSGNEQGPALAIDPDNPDVKTQYLQFRTTLPLEEEHLADATGSRAAAGPPSAAPALRRVAATDKKYPWPAPLAWQVHRSGRGLLPATPRTYRWGMGAATLFFVLAVNQGQVGRGTVLFALAAASVFAALPGFERAWKKYGPGWQWWLWGVFALFVALGFFSTLLESTWLAAVAIGIGLHFPPLVASWFATRRDRRLSSGGSAAPDDDNARSTKQRGRPLDVLGMSLAIAVFSGLAATDAPLAWFMAVLAIVALVFVKYLVPAAFADTGPRTPSFRGAQGARRKLRSMLAAASPVLVGVASVFVLSRIIDSDRYLVGAGLGLAVAGLSVLGVFLHATGRAPVPSLKSGWTGLRTVVYIGAVVFGIFGYRGLMGAVNDFWLGSIVFVAAAVVGAFFVWPRELTLVFILAGLIFVWSVADTESNLAGLDREFAIEMPSASDVNAANDPVLRGNWHVVIGDSFISGEGADRFASGTNTRPINACRRATTAWPHLLDSPTTARSGTISFACSGATVAQIADTPQNESGEGWRSGNATQIAELAAFADEVHAAGGTISHVFISAGGNDAGFSDLIITCISPSADCSRDGVGEAFVARAAQLGDSPGGTSLSGMYVDAVDAVHKPWRDDPDFETPPELRVLVATYVDPVDEYHPWQSGELPPMTGGVDETVIAAGAAEGADDDEPRRKRPSDEPPCNTRAGSLLEFSEVDVVHTFRTVLNSRIADAVALAQIERPEARLQLVNLEQALDNRSVCSDDPGINWFDLRPADDNLAETIARLDFGSIEWSAWQMLPWNWVNSSLHPNESGHRSIALVVDSCLDALDQDPVVGARVCSGESESMSCRSMAMTGELADELNAEDAPNASVSSDVRCSPPACIEIADGECEPVLQATLDARDEAVRSAQRSILGGAVLALLAGFLLAAAQAVPNAERAVDKHLLRPTGR
ncbi:MAG: hypothetical protein AAF567_26560 [Actinomycetota bacterium]